MRKKEVLLFLGGLACGILIGSVLGVKAGSDLRTAVDQSSEEMTENVVTAVVARVNLAKGAILTGDSLGKMEMREERLPLNCIDVSADKTAYLGKSLAIPIKRFAPLSWDYLQSPDESRLSGSIGVSP